MANAVGAVRIDLVANTAKFASGMKRAGNNVTGFKAKVASAAGGLRRFAGAALAAVGVGGLGYLVKSNMEAIDSTGKLARQLGVGTEQLMGLRHAAELTGAGAKSLDAGLATMAKRLGEAARGSGAATPALAELGLEAGKLIQMSPDQAFREIAGALEGIEEPAKRNAIAANLFSKANMGLLNTLAAGTAGIDAMIAEAKKLGRTLTEEQIAKVEEANDAMTRLKGAAAGLAASLTTTLAPAILAVADAMSSMFAWFQSVDMETVKTVARFAAFAAGMYVALKVIPLVVNAIRGMIAIYKALTAAKAIALAFGGPSGLASIAAGLLVAAGAVYATDAAFNEIEKGMAEAQTQAEDLSRSIDNTGKTMADAGETAAKGWESFGSTLDKLQADIDTFWMSSRERERYMARLAGASDEQIAKIKDLHQELDRLDKIKEMRESMREEPRTDGRSAPSLVQRGTQAAYRATLETQRSQIAELEKQTGLLEDIERLLGRDTEATEETVYTL